MKKPTIEEVKEAIKTCIKFIGDDPEREGLRLTPDRVIKSWVELFGGYEQDVESILSTKFYETANFQDFVLLRGIKLHSFCEHHLLPIIGSVDIAYIPDGCVVGVSKLARIVEVFARRLQIQEKMTVEIAEALQKYLSPLGVAVRISAKHFCMKLRGVNQDANMMDTMHYTGIFVNEQKFRHQFLDLVT